MREFAKVSPAFWIGKTGRALRGRGPNHQLLAIYLLTAPSANMLGLYYIPFSMMAHESGIPIDEIQGILDFLAEIEFAFYDHEFEYVLVVEMAAFQVLSPEGHPLKENDKRVKGIQADVAECPSGVLKHMFIDRYRDQFNISDENMSRKPKNRAKIASGLRWAVFERDRHTCKYCGRSSPAVQLEVDHVVPESAGGKTEIGNLVTACVECNNGKTNKPLSQGLGNTQKPLLQDLTRALLSDSSANKPLPLPLPSKEMEMETDTETETETENNLSPSPQPPTDSLLPEPQQVVVEKQERKDKKQPKPAKEKPCLTTEDKKWFVEQWQTQYPGADPAWEHDNVTWIRMYARLKTHPLEEIRRRWLLYFRKTGNYFDGHSLKTFLDRDFDKALESANGNGGGYRSKEIPVDPTIDRSCLGF
jgi:hypothetical protein